MKVIFLLLTVVTDSVFICNNLMIPQFVLAAVCVLIQTVAYTARCRVACEGHSKMTSRK